jgi:hypothetical protein
MSKRSRSKRAARKIKRDPVVRRLHAVMWACSDPLCVSQSAHYGPDVLSGLIDVDVYG